MSEPSKHLPKISVLIITYNAEKFVEAALSSIISQTYDLSLIEIILGDDASTDLTLARVEDFNAKHQLHNLILIKHENNVGISRNFNSCLERCTGKYIFLLGGDDLFLPEKIKMQVEFMEKNLHTWIAYHNVEVFDSASNHTLYFYNNRHKAYSGGASYIIEHGTFCCGTSVAVRNENLPLCREDVRYSSDWLWYVDILKRNENSIISYMDGVYARYRRHQNNITTELSCNILKGLSEVEASLNLMLNSYPEEIAAIKKSFAERWCAYALKALLKGNFLLMVNLICKSFRMDLFGFWYFLKRRIYFIK